MGMVMDKIDTCISAELNLVQLATIYAEKVSA